MNQNMIFGYENVTHYLHFAENHIRFNPVRYEEMWIFVKNVKSPVCPSFWQIAGSQCTEWAQALLNVGNEVTSLFLSAIIVMQYMVLTLRSTDLCHSSF